MTREMRMNNNRKLCLAVLAVVFSGALTFFGGEVSSWVNKTPDKINCRARSNICGFIDKKFESKLITAINTGAEGITVSSTGGDILIAINIVNLLNKENVRLRIDGLCLSACARILVLGTNRVTLNENSLVGFHQSANFMNRLAQVHLRKHLNYIAHVETISNLEKGFFVKNDIKLQALYAPSEMLEYHCFEDKIIDHMEDKLIVLHSNYNWYAPKRGVLVYWRNKSGLIGGAHDVADFKSKSLIYKNFLKNNSVIFAGVGETKDLVAYIDKIKPCKKAN